MREEFESDDADLHFYVNEVFNTDNICFMVTGQHQFDTENRNGIFCSPMGADAVMSKDTFKRMLKMLMRFDEAIS